MSFLFSVIPAEAGIQDEPRQRRYDSYGSQTLALDPRFRGDDGKVFEMEVTSALHHVCMP